MLESGEGATEPVFYRPEDAPPGRLTFQYLFDRDGLVVPDAADIGLGLRCWAAPARGECADRGD